MKKTWIKIKRGLLTPEHREKLGVRVWLYMYMLDRADWDSGTIYGWKDKDEAQDFGMNWRTLQQQRQQLETDGYISCEQKAHYQNITIHNWTNPREYSGDLYNPISGGTEINVPTDGDTRNRVPLEGTSQGTNQGIRKHSTPTYSPHITGHEERPDFESMEIKDALKVPEIAIYNEVTGRIPGYYQYEIIWETIGQNGFTVDYLRPFWKEWAGNRGYRPGNNAWLTDWAVSGEIPSGRPGQQEDKPLSEQLEAQGYDYRRAD